MGKTFKDQRRYNTKQQLRLPRVRFDMDTTTEVHEDRREKRKHKKLRDWEDEIGDDFAQQHGPDYQDPLTSLNTSEDDEEAA